MFPGLLKHTFSLQRICSQGTVVAFTWKNDLIDHQNSCTFIFCQSNTLWINLLIQLSVCVGGRFHRCTICMDHHRHCQMTKCMSGIPLADRQQFVFVCTCYVPKTRLKNHKMWLLSCWNGVKCESWYVFPTAASLLVKPYTEIQALDPLGDRVDIRQCCRDPVLFLFFFFPPTLACDSVCFFCVVFDKQKVTIPNS